MREAYKTVYDIDHKFCMERLCWWKLRTEVDC